MRARVPQDSPTRRASRKENFATYRPLSKGAASLNMSMAGVTSLLKKKAGLMKDSNTHHATSSSLLGPTLRSHRPEKHPGSTKNSARDPQPLKEIPLTENNAVIRARTPSLDYSKLTWVEKENFNLARDYSADIHAYLKKIEAASTCSLSAHKITHTHRARMIDWMIEVLTNFKCEDQTFFTAVSLLDRFLKLKRPGR